MPILGKKCILARNCDKFHKNTNQDKPGVTSCDGDDRNPASMTFLGHQKAGRKKEKKMKKGTKKNQRSFAALPFCPLGKTGKLCARALDPKSGQLLAGASRGWNSPPKQSRNKTEANS